ncbi:flagellar hook-associated protein FlgK [Rhodovibrio sodomensis]|uniref:Flagellar hook-associated protein 1 n=1 Tax=Rhodovibrio sodomensis TaxID=1088 RepID=A0ABS1DKF3_9PROT|nr:flagellar hook-associated protein FlgK [Rhodovibrio sodomensis]MBK1670996.1 flagellar hook-associated protein FlgK [Rhodovibrio sodomensis]
MSLSGSLFHGISGLQTAQRQIEVTSGNVSNANVDGYSQKTAAAVTRMVDGQSSGVDIGPIRREVDTYLDSEAMRARTELGALNTRSEYLNRFGKVFGTLSNDSTLANGLNALSSALEALSIEPESASARRDVVEAADAVARQFNRISTETTDLRVEASNEIDQGVATINDALDSVAELNDEISRAEALDRPTADLRDERDRQLETLSEWMDISTFSRDNGAIAVMGKMADGSTKMLVDSSAVQFDFTKANALGPIATASDGVPTLVNAGTPAAASDQLGATTGGRLGALLDVRDNTLTDFHRDIDRLAQTVRDRVNAAHNLGTAGNAATASSETITGSRAFGGADGFPDGITSVSGTLTLSEVDGDGNVTDTYNIDMGLVDSALPTGATVSDLQDALNAVATSLPGVTNNPFDLTGGTDGRLVMSAPNGSDFTVSGGSATVEGAAGERNFSHYFGLNNLFETSGTTLTGVAGNIRVNADIKMDPAELSAGRASTTVDQQAVPVGDAGVAQAMAAAFEARGTIAASGGNLKAVDTTMSGYAADILSFQASETSRTDTARDFQQTMYDELKFRSDSKSGVNIDEELSNMLVFEQAYNASARVISTVQEMFDTLDRMIN